MDYVEVAPSQIIMCQGNIFHNQYMYVLGDLNFSNHFGATIAGLYMQEPLPNLYADPELSVPLPNNIHQFCISY